MKRRVNLRRPAGHAEKLAFFHISRVSSDPAKLLADFVGCVDGSRSLSTNYKKELRRFPADLSDPTRFFT